MYYVYIVQCKDGTLYTGWTTNIEKRLIKHNEGKGAKYTRARFPVNLECVIEFKTQKEAMQAEYNLKQLSREEKIIFIEQNK